MSARLDALRTYVALAIAEGEFKGVMTPSGVVARVSTILTVDLAKIAGEMAEMTGKKFTGAALEKLGEVASSVMRDPGKAWGKVKKMWNTAQETHRRGTNNLRGDK